MYARDPRADWSAQLAYRFPGTAGKPDDLLDLTPGQLDHLLTVNDKTTEGLKA